MTGRRGYELVSLALARLKQQRPHTRIVVFGNTEPIPNLPFEAEQVGSLKDAALADLFRRAAVVMVASLTNYSIIPVEAMACGALVVDVDRPSVSSMFRHGEELLLAPVHVPGLADTLQGALDDKVLRQRVTATAAARLDRYRWPDILAGFERDLLDAYFR
jgi:glycosyltransferase involved in cell wall biosynthesis